MFNTLTLQVIEEVEERFTEDDIEKILETVKTMLPDTASKDTDTDKTKE